jgi:hypothetical protein
MKRVQQLEEGHSGFDLMEEAFHLLRSARPATLVTYYIGTIPFVLGALYFWSDMSQSAFARERLGTASLGMAALYFWAKFWQSIFARRLLFQRGYGDRLRSEPTLAARMDVRAGARLNPSEESGLGFMDLLRIACVQSLIQATGLFLWPIALILLLPFGWVNAFYQSATVLGLGAGVTDPSGGSDGSLVSTVKKAAQQAQLWVLHNHVFLLVWKGFWLFVLMNWMAAAMALPYLAKTFFGLESPFTKSPFVMMNTTFFAVMVVLTYLSTDPIHKAVYVLRCFYGQSLRTARDLRAELAEFLPGQNVRMQNHLARVAAIALASLAFVILPAGAGARPLADVEPDAPNGHFTHAHQEQTQDNRTVSPSHLDRSISEVLQQREYSWRLPRADVEREAGLVEGFVASIGETIASWVKAVGRWLSKVLDRILKFLRPPVSLGGSGMGLALAIRALAFVALVLLVFFAAMFAFRLWRRHAGRPDDVVLATPTQAPPDLSDHNVAADQLPENEWIKLGRELLQRGELRLAMRAFYLASLAHLAQRNLITLARYKSNYDYHRELRRRAHALPVVTDLFDENIRMFDRSWYGLHPVDESALDRFASNVERIKCA